MSSSDTAAVTSVKTYDNLKFLYYNTRRIVYKTDELKVSCLLHKPDIVCIVETCNSTDSDVLNSEVCISMSCLDWTEIDMVEELLSVLLVTSLLQLFLLVLIPLSF